MPVLQFGGYQLTQSTAIARYFARKHGLAGSNDFESAKCDEYVEAAKDWRYEFLQYKDETDPVQKEEYRINFLRIHCPSYLDKFNRIIQDNPAGDWLVGSNVSWADFFLVVFIEFFEETLHIDLMKGYPALQNLKKNVYSIPQIKNWIHERPPNKF